MAFVFGAIAHGRWDSDGECTKCSEIEFNLTLPCITRTPFFFWAFSDTSIDLSFLIEYQRVYCRIGTTPTGEFQEHALVLACVAHDQAVFSPSVCSKVSFSAEHATAA